MAVALLQMKSDMTKKAKCPLDWQTAEPCPPGNIGTTCRTAAVERDKTKVVTAIVTAA